MSPAVGVLVPTAHGPPVGAPESRPIGRAALELEREGVAVVFGDEVDQGAMTGLRARDGSWVRAEGVEVVGIHDRFPSQRDASRYAEIRARLGALPLVNPTWLTLLCRDKLASQRLLEAERVPMPPVEDDPTRFAERVEAWGAAFIKPRYGAFGRNVRRVVPGDELPARGEGALVGVEEPMLLQRAVSAPVGWAGISVRVNCQRLPGGGWYLNPGVARRSRRDPVVNASRGAEVALAEDVLHARTLLALERDCLRSAEALCAMPDGHLVGELGVDAVIDPAGIPWVVEVNSRPRGRLEVLAERWPDRFQDLHVQACARPLRYLLQRFGGRSGLGSG